MMPPSHPKRITIEITTRCNLHCDFCVKYAQGSKIAEGDISLEAFKQILPSFTKAKEIVLSGIGEPLLHPDLSQMVKMVRDKMARDGSISFQSNGILLSTEKATELLSAGLDSICLSIDSLKELSLTVEHSIQGVASAIDVLKKVRPSINPNFTIGIEIVLSKGNISEFLDLVQWSLKQGVNYIIVSHLLAYDTEQKEQSLFPTHPEVAKSIFTKYQAIAKSQGLSLAEKTSHSKQFIKEKSEKILFDINKEMNAEAKEQDTHLHLDMLLAEEDQPNILEVLEEARKLAAENEIKITLPSVQALNSRYCRFIEEDHIFVSQNGRISPCHFLWHTYSCVVCNEMIDVEAKHFGDITTNTIEDSWNSKPYKNFRDEVKKYDFPFCTSCTQGPCNDLVNSNVLGANDCYSSNVPCGHCMWNLGGLNCL